MQDSVYSQSFQGATAWILLVLGLLEGVTGFGTCPPPSSALVSELAFGLLNGSDSLELYIILIGPPTLFFVLHATSGLGSCR
ncbi:MAG: hypothetical protein ACP5HQ_03330 [Thermoprotei archaeon]